MLYLDDYKRKVEAEDMVELSRDTLYWLNRNIKHYDNVHAKGVDFGLAAENQFEWMRAKGCFYEECDFSTIRLHNAEFQNVYFRNCNFEYAKANNIVFKNCVFDGCNLSNMQGANAEMHDTIITDCIIQDLRLEFSNIKDSLFLSNGGMTSEATAMSVADCTENAMWSWVSPDPQEPDIDNLIDYTMDDLDGKHRKHRNPAIDYKECFMDDIFRLADVENREWQNIVNRMNKMEVQYESERDSTLWQCEHNVSGAVTQHAKKEFKTSLEAVNAMYNQMEQDFVEFNVERREKYKCERGFKNSLENTTFSPKYTLDGKTKDGKPVHVECNAGMVFALKQSKSIPKPRKIEVVFSPPANKNNKKVQTL